MTPESAIDTGPEVARFEQMEASSVKSNSDQSFPTKALALAACEGAESEPFPRLVFVLGCQPKPVEMAEMRGKKGCDKNRIIFWVHQSQNVIENKRRNVSAYVTKPECA